MVRSITGALGTEVDRETGSRPVIVIEAYFHGIQQAPYKYADVDYDNIPGKILSISGLDTIVKIGNRGSTGQIQLTLDDTDGSIKTILDTSDLHKKYISIFQCYSTLAITEKAFLFTGEINTPVVWNEGDRTVSFNLTERVENTEVGFTPEQGAFANLDPEAVGKMWPLVFGTVHKVPAQRITARLQGEALTYYSIITLSEINHLVTLVNKYANAARAKLNAETEVTDIQDEPQYYIDIVVSYHKAKTELEDYKQKLKHYSQSLSGAIDSFIANVYELNFDEDELAVKTDTKDEKAKYLVQVNATIQRLSNPPNVINTGQILAFQTYADLLTSEIAELTIEIAELESTITTRKQQNKTHIRELTAFTLDTIIVDKGYKWVQNQDVEVLIKGVRFEGQFSGTTFTINEVLPYYSNINILPGTALNEFELPTNTYLLKGKFCLIGSNDTLEPVRIIYISEQQGTRCIFNTLLFKRSTNPGFFYEPLQLNQTYTILEASSVILEHWYDMLDETLHAFITGFSAEISEIDWSLEIGDPVISNAFYEDVYVCNAVPSVAIRDVSGYRSIKGVKRLVPIPSSYYVKNLNDPYDTVNATTLTFKKPLSDYLDENWDGTVFVTVKSTISSNTATAIEYLVNNFSHFDPDPSSFAIVASQIANYPSNFVITERVNVLKLIEDIAWQARCVTYIYDIYIKIKYLSVFDDAVGTITESDIVARSVHLEYTETEQLITKFIGHWKNDQSKDTTNKVILRNNTFKYGEITQESDFYIYDREDLVIKSMTFWIIRYSNTWKRVRFKTFLNKLRLETWDTIVLQLGGIVGGSATYAVLENVTYDPVDTTLVMECWVPTRAGFMDDYDFAWPGSVGLGIEYPGIDDLYVGGATDGQIVTTGGNFDYQNRFNDLGSIVPGDANDVLPIEPFQLNNELDYTVPNKDKPKPPAEITIDVNRTKVIDTTTGYNAPLSDVVQVVKGTPGENTIGATQATDQVYLVLKNTVRFVGDWFKATFDSSGNPSFEKQNVFNNLQLKFNETLKQWLPESTYYSIDIFLARITAWTTIPATTNRFKYSWIEVAHTEPGVYDDVINGRVGVINNPESPGDPTQDLYEAYNVIEAYNDGSLVEGNSVSRAGGYPAGFLYQPVGGGRVNMEDIYGIVNNVIVIMYALRIGGGDKTLYTFQYENADDGPCTT